MDDCVVWGVGLVWIGYTHTPSHYCTGIGIGVAIIAFAFAWAIS